MATPSSVPISGTSSALEGVVVNTAAGSGLFRESVVLADGTDPLGYAAVTSSAPLVPVYGPAVWMQGAVAISSYSGNPISVNVVSSVALPIGITSWPAAGISTFASAIGVSSMTTPLGITSHPAGSISTFTSAIGVSSFSPPIGITSHPAGSVSTITTGIGVTSVTVPVGISSFAAPIGVTSHPASGVSTITSAIGVSSITAAVGVSSVTTPIGISSYTAGAISTASVPISGGGLTVATILALNTTNSTVVKAGPGIFYGASMGNNAASPYYLKVINASSAVQVSSAVMFMRFMCQGSTATHYSPPVGITMSTGIYVATTQAAGNADNTAIAASSAVINIYYN